MSHSHPDRGSVTLMASLFISVFMALYLHAITKILYADKTLKEENTPIFASNIKSF